MMISPICVVNDVSSLVSLFINLLGASHHHSMIMGYFIFKGIASINRMYIMTSKMRWHESELECLAFDSYDFYSIGVYMSFSNIICLVFFGN